VEKPRRLRHLKGRNAEALAAPIQPVKPDFPDQFHSAIQVSIQDKGYSYVLYESYDYTCNAVVQEYYSSHFGHSRLLFNFRDNSAENRLWRMYAPNTTYPKGICVSQRMEAEVPYENVDGKHVATTKHFLGLRDDNMEYVDEHKPVRCAVPFNSATMDLMPPSAVAGKCPALAIMHVP
jgi:hypothetical protein